MPITDAEIESTFTYHAPTEDEVRRMNEMRDKAKELALLLVRNVPASADQSAALRKLRECTMTANAGILLNRPKAPPTL
jgi:hypothetical protein